MSELLSHKDFYPIPLKRNEPVNEDLVKDCYATFACRHKFCREVCPVYREERNEAYIPYGFNTAILAVSRGVADLAELDRTFTYCLECGACELRCPTTLFAGDFYKRTTTTADLVRKVRRDLLAEGIRPAGWGAVEETVAEHRDRYQGPVAELTRWAADLDLPRSGKTMLFVDYFNAFQTTEVPRLAARILKAAGVPFGILDRPAITTGELLESDLNAYLEHARANLAALQQTGAETVVTVNPHEHVFFIRELPKHFGPLPFRVVYITEFLADLHARGWLTFTRAVPRKVTYHDPCTLNKQAGDWESPRRLIQAIPGIEFADEDPVTQWSYCCGNGVASFKKLHPDTAYKIGLRRLRGAAEMAETLILACPHCKDQFAEVRARAGFAIELTHILELVAEGMGLGDR